MCVRVLVRVCACVCVLVRVYVHVSVAVRVRVYACICADVSLRAYACQTLRWCALTVTGMCGIINDTNSFFVVWAIMLSFFLTHFEKYNTGEPRGMWPAC